MRILHCITGLSGDGAQRMLLRLAEGLSGRGITSTVVSLGARGELAPHFRRLGIPVSSLSMGSPAGFLPGLLMLRRIIRTVRPDVIQGWMYHANVVALAAREMSGCRAPVVWNIRRGLDDIAERKRSTQAVVRGSAWLSPRAAGIVYCSRRSRDQHEGIGFSRLAGAVIGNGFDVGRFSPSESARCRVRHELGVGDEEVLIGNVGRHDVAKGREFLLDAFCRLAASRPHVRLLCVGRGVSWGERPFSGYASAKLVRERVVLLDGREDIQDIFTALDVYCSSSIAEGFPNVIAEAMASGVPVVATDTGATAEILSGCGRLVAPRSARDLHAALKALVDEPRGSLVARGIAGRHEIERCHSLESVVSRYETAYRETASGDPRSAGGSIFC